jgi:hypothetical protein
VNQGRAVAFDLFLEGKELPGIAALTDKTS